MIDKEKYDKATQEMHECSELLKQPQTEEDLREIVARIRQACKDIKEAVGEEV